MPVTDASVVALQTYRFKAEDLVRRYVLDDTYVPYTSVLTGIFMCKMVYDLIQILSSFYFKGYSSLTKIQNIEWKNRGMSSMHAVFITIMSLYLVFLTDLFSDNNPAGPVTLRTSNLSVLVLGVSLGYFITDLAMIFWVYPSLGGLEFVIHHFLSVIAIPYTMLSGEGQLYTFMVLISEATTPGVNLRWFLDTAGMKQSTAYLVNGASVFCTWLVARILLFIYIFLHIYKHFNQIKQLHVMGRLLALLVPAGLFILNVMWFFKILKGIRKTLAKKRCEGEP